MKKELCHHCGASMMMNKYTMNKTLVNALAKLWKSPGKVAGQVGFTKSEYSVYTKLKFWGFIRQLTDEGLWEVTREGKEFLAGRGTAAKEITYFRNRLMEQTEEKVSIFQVYPTEESRQKYKAMMRSFK